MASNQDPLVSFVVPCYNYGRYLPDCLSSIFNQEGKHDFEVVVIDDGSTDNTQAVLREYADPRLRVITHQVNQGHVATINEGLSQARGKFVARIDPDDRYRPRFLSTVLDKFDAYPDVGLVYGDAAIINEHGQIASERSDRVHGGQDFKGNEFVHLLEENFICSPTVIARHEAWHAALPVPKGLAFHDWYFTLMIARKHDFYYVDQVLAEYRVHPANHHSKISRDKSEETSIFWLLDRIFNEQERNRELETQKRQARRQVYGAHYLDIATKYFGHGMDSDARRCYLQAIQHRPRYLLRLDVLRRLLATIIGRTTYEYGKALVKSLRAGSL